MIPALRGCNGMRRRLMTLRAFGAALLLAFPAIGVGAAEAAGLFSADDGAVPPRQMSERLLREDSFPEARLRGEAPGGFAPSPELRSRIAAIDFGQLAAARSEIGQGHPSNLRLNLFTDANFQAVFERTAPTTSGYTLTGRLADDPLSTVVLAVNNSTVAGAVSGLDGFYSIRGGVGGVSVQQMDPASQGRCGVHAVPSEARLDASQAPRDVQAAAHRARASSTDGSALVDNGSVIDVLVVYDAHTRISHGGHRAMRAMIDRDVEMTNEAYRTSGAEQKIALVGAVEVDYPRKTGRGTDLKQVLDHLELQGDGYLDEVHALRDSYAADLVVLHVGELPSHLGGVGYTIGVASVPETPLGREDWAFSVAKSQAFAHELGHSMGLKHERQRDLSNKPFPYSHGYRFEVPCMDPTRIKPCEASTVMAARLPMLPRFSNPRQKHKDGTSLGIPGDEPSDRIDGPADAVRSLNEMRRAIANYRPSAERCAYALSPEFPVLPAAGGEFRLRVETAPGCKWSARSDGGFLSIAEGSKGVGGGEVVYRAPDNPGWDREAALLVAAEVYLVRQEGARPVTPVCERTLEVSEAIAAALDKPCAEISGADLASVGALRVDLPRGGVPKLESGDFSGLSGLGWLFIAPDSAREEKPSLRLSPDLFDGLSGLRHLHMDGNAISALPPGLFKDLSELDSLDLSTNQLIELAPGVFDGLDNLRDLDLRQNGLSRLPLGLFDGLTKVRTLHLGENRLTALEPGLFRDLSGLSQLQLYGNQISALESDVFNGLSRLIVLNIGENQLTALTPGLFDGLPKLDHLSIHGNQLVALEPSLFKGLPLLHALDIAGNRLTTLPRGLFDDLPALKRLALDGNRLATLAPDIFSGLPLEHLWLTGNRLASLPPGLLEGQAKLWTLDFSDNPGAPFPLRFELVALPASDSSRGHSIEVAVEVASGIPFNARAGLSASGGVLSSGSASIGAGRTRSDRISVAQAGEGPVVVELDAVPVIPDDQQCDSIPTIYHALPGWRCYWGMQPIAGPPLVLHGFLDQTLTPDSAVKFHLPSAFPGFGAGTSYAIESSNLAAVAAMIREGLLIVSATDGGETTLTVTATSPDGRRETRRFAVKVEQPIRSRWGGWRSALLRPPPSEDSDES